MYTFKKEERLCNKKLIDQLFHKGSSFLCYPYRVSWMLINEKILYPAQVVFPVAKKRFKRAADRNAIRRRMREAYRLNKQDFLYTPLEASQQQLILSISYVGKEILPYDFMENKMVSMFALLQDQSGLKPDA